MQTIEIAVNGTSAVMVTPITIVCGNSDYSIHFTFSDEWDAYTAKTAVFTFFSMQTGKINQYEVLFEGDTVSVPAVTNTITLSVGVIAGDVKTTTDANIPCMNSNTGTAMIHDDPPHDIYEQLLSYLAGLQGGGIAGQISIQLAGAESTVAGNIVEVE